MRTSPTHTHTQAYRIMICTCTYKFTNMYAALFWWCPKSLVAVCPSVEYRNWSLTMVLIHRCSENQSALIFSSTIILTYCSHMLILRIILWIHRRSQTFIVLVLIYIKGRCTPKGGRLICADAGPRSFILPPTPGGTLVFTPSVGHLSGGAIRSATNCRGPRRRGWSQLNRYELVSPMD